MTKTQKTALTLFFLSSAGVVEILIHTPFSTLVGVFFLMWANNISLHVETEE